MPNAFCETVQLFRMISQNKKKYYPNQEKYSSNRISLISSLNELIQNFQNKIERAMLFEYIDFFLFNMNTPWPLYIKVLVFYAHKNKISTIFTTDLDIQNKCFENVELYVHTFLNILNNSSKHDTATKFLIIYTSTCELYLYKQNN